MGKQVAKDTKETNKLTGWTHSVKIKELQEDSSLSHSYLEDLAQKATKVSDLQELKSYLSNPIKTINLTNPQRGSLVHLIKGKLQQIDEHEILQQIIQHVKEHGMWMY